MEEVRPGVLKVGRRWGVVVCEEETHSVLFRHSVLEVSTLSPALSHLGAILGPDLL